MTKENKSPATLFLAEFDHQLDRISTVRIRRYINRGVKKRQERGAFWQCRIFRPLYVPEKTDWISRGIWITIAGEVNWYCLSTFKTSVRKVILTDGIGGHPVCFITEAEEIRDFRTVECTQYWGAWTPYISYDKYEMRDTNESGLFTVGVGWLSLGGHLKHKTTRALEDHVAL